MAKTIRTKIIGTVREIRRSTRIDILSTVNTPVMITAYREVLLCDDQNAIVSQKNDSSFTRTIPGIESETIMLADGTVLTGAQVAAAVEAFVEKWDAETIAAQNAV